MPAAAIGPKWATGSWAVVWEQYTWTQAPIVVVVGTTPQDGSNAAVGPSGGPGGRPWTTSELAAIFGIGGG